MALYLVPINLNALKTIGLQREWYVNENYETHSPSNTKK